MLSQSVIAEKGKQSRWDTLVNLLLIDVILGFLLTFLPEQ